MQKLFVENSGITCISSEGVTVCVYSTMHHGYVSLQHSKLKYVDIVVTKSAVSDNCDVLMSMS